MRVNDMMNKKNCWLRLLVSSGVLMLQVGNVHLCDMRTWVAVHCKVSYHSSPLHSTKTKWNAPPRIHYFGTNSSHHLIFLNNPRRPSTFYYSIIWRRTGHKVITIINIIPSTNQSVNVWWRYIDDRLPNLLCNKNDDRSLTILWNGYPLYDKSYSYPYPPIIRYGGRVTIIKYSDLCWWCWRFSEPKDINCNWNWVIVAWMLNVSM